MYRVAPTSNNLTFPYYSASGDANHTEPLVPPIDITNTNTMNGLLGLPDPKKFDLEYDDLKNLYDSSIVPFSTA
jgi:hypothetical protein